MKNGTENMLVNGSIKTFYVRTLISYNSDTDYTLPNKGLSYEIGEILCVKNASDINWWSSVRLNPTKMSLQSSDKGLIPSAERLRKRYSHKEATVNFEEKTIVIDPNGTQTVDKINLSLPKGWGSIDMKRKRQQVVIKVANVTTESRDKLSDFYEIVEPIKSLLPRPVVVVGPGRTHLYDRLVELYPDLFASPINHTTRPKRGSEIDGMDYYFIENKNDFIDDKEAGRFVEIVEYGGNMYGTSLLAVQTVMASKKHCIIDATIGVINNLEKNGIDPISILICPDSYAVAKDLMGSNVDEKLIKTTMQYSAMLNGKDRHTFAVKLRCGNMTDLIKETYTTVINCQKWGAWKRSEDNSKLGYGIY